jgi:cyclic pyranopterin phosphate synthase
MAKLTHFNDSGEAHMVHVGSKPETERVAAATGAVAMRKETLQEIQRGGIQKGDVLGLARIAGIQAAKRTSDLIPLCHPVRLTGIEVSLEARDDGEPRVEIVVTVRAFDRTGVEMEALTGVTVAALTIYDMCKAIDRDITIVGVRLLEKRGGRSGEYRRSI